MRAVITGAIVSFRYADIKGTKVGQFDLVQYGSNHHPSKVITLYIPASAYVRLLLQNMTSGSQPTVSFLCWLTFGRELEIEVLELLSITGGVTDGTNGSTNTDTSPDDGSDTAANGNGDRSPGSRLHIN